MPIEVVGPRTIMPMLDSSAIAILQTRISRREGKRGMKRGVSQGFNTEDCSLAIQYNSVTYTNLSMAKLIVSLNRLFNMDIRLGSAPSLMNSETDFAHPLEFCRCIE